MSVQSLERAFDILELVSTHKDGVSLARISEELGLHKSTVHRLLAVCRERGYVNQEGQTGFYRLGPHFLELSSRFLNAIEIKTEAGPVLQQLSEELRQTVFMAMLQDNTVVYIDKFEKINSIRRYTIIGQRRPVHCTSLGKALLFGKTADEIARIIGTGPYQKYTGKTITTLELLEQEIRKCEKRGWTFDDAEFEEGVCCIGAPIYDYRGGIIAAISTAWAYDFSKGDEEIRRNRVIQAAQEISKLMGFCNG